LKSSLSFHSISSHFFRSSYFFFIEFQVQVVDRVHPALTGAVFGAFLSGVLYRLSKGKLVFAVLGEVIGTGVIGAIVSYPVMTYLMGREGLSWLFYVPSFTCGTLIGGSIAFFFLRKLCDNGMLARMQDMLASPVYTDKGTVVSNALCIAAFGPILFVLLHIVPGLFHMEGQLWSYLAYGALAVFVILAIGYFAMKTGRREVRDQKVT